jgi:hypothetical protein
MNKVLEFLGMGKGNLIDSIVNGVDKFVTTTEEKEKMRQDMERIVSGYVLEASKIALEDVVSARKREVDLKGTLGAWVMNIAAAIFILLFVCQVIIPWTGLPEPISPGYQNSVKTLEYILIAIVSYWFGSSRSSNVKDEMLNKTIGK